MNLDLVISGGTVLDGTGGPALRADVGIVGDRIVAISPEPLRAATSIDAHGQVVTPGFIDLHSHADFTVESAPAAPAVLHQGVTTLLTGNCGLSPFPVSPGGSGALTSMQPELELSWSWHDAGSFARRVQQVRPAVNVALQLGHGAVRSAVLGGADRVPDETEVLTLRQHIAAAAEQGVQGFSTGLIYAPGSFAHRPELRELVAEAARHGLLHSTHVRDETSRLLEAVEEALWLARETGVRLQVSHLKAMGPANHGEVHTALELLSQARRDGFDVAADVYPYTASSTTLTSRLPGWAMDGGPEALVERLADPGTRSRVAAALEARFGVDIDPAGIVVGNLPPGRFSAAVGEDLLKIAAVEGVPAAEAALRLLENHRGQVAIVNHAMAPDDVDAVLRDPFVAIASDGDRLDLTGGGNPHPRSYGTFPRVLGRYVRERGVLTLTEAVRKMTALPASRLGWTDRGVLRVGAIADVTVFDPRTVADRATYTDPLHYAVGVSSVLVGGRTALLDGRPTGERGGRVLTDAA